MHSTLRNIIVAALTSAIVTAGALVVFQKYAGVPYANPTEIRQKERQVTQVVTEESAITDAVQKVEPSVVSVIISKDLPVLEQYYVDPFGGDPFFNQFNFGIPQYRDSGQTEKKEIGGGTAFFISSDGLLLTNKHVVEDEDAEYTVLLNDGTKLEAEVVARDPGNDIALLKVEGDDFPALTIAPENTELLLGQTVIAIGNSLGEFRNTISVGVISGLLRTITAGSSKFVEQLDQVIQTDAAINHGNSGGPLLNLEGQVIGMNTAIAEGGQNVGFAIHFRDLQRAVKSYKEHGKIIRPWLGIRYMPITKELKEKNSLPFDYGVLIVRGENTTDLAVIPGSPADKAGLQENDIILEFDGKKLDAETSLARLVQDHLAGDEVTLKVYSKGKEKEVKVTLEEQE